jgi:hypothetical protein
MMMGAGTQRRFVHTPEQHSAASEHLPASAVQIGGSRPHVPVPPSWAEQYPAQQSPGAEHSAPSGSHAARHRGEPAPSGRQRAPPQHCSS